MTVPISSKTGQSDSLAKRRVPEGADRSHQRLLPVVPPW